MIEGSQHDKKLGLSGKLRSSLDIDPIRSPFIRQLSWVEDKLDGILGTQVLKPIEPQDRLRFHAKSSATGRKHIGFSQDTAFVSGTLNSPDLLYYFGQPLARLEKSDRSAAERAWLAVHERTRRHLATPPEMIRRNLPTSRFGITLYNLLALLVPFSRAAVFETNCRQGQLLVSKYFVEVRDAEVNVETNDTIAEFQYVPTSRSGSRSRTLQLGGELFVDIRAVTKISELLNHKKGPPTNRRTLGLGGNETSVAIALRGPDVDVVVLTDSSVFDGLSAVGDNRLADLFLGAGRHVVDRIAYVKAGDKPRSEARHALTQTHKKSMDLVGTLIREWTDRDDISSDVIERLAELNQQVDLTNRRIEYLGRNPFDIFGVENVEVGFSSGLSLAAKGEPVRERMPLIETLERFISGYQTKVEMRVQIPYTDLLPALETDWEALRGCIDELVANAEKYGGEGRPIVLRVQSVKKGGIAVEVLSSGSHVTDREWPILKGFGIRGRHALASNVKGSGGGLAMVEETVEDLGAKLNLGFEIDGKNSGNRLFVASLVYPKRYVTKE